MSGNLVFAVQDTSGTVVQLTTSSPGAAHAVQIGDTGTYAGVDFDDINESVANPVSYTFAVTQVNDSEHFCISVLNPITGKPVGNVMSSDWPTNGTVTWLTGGNANTTTGITSMDPANAYCTVAFFESYNDSRGNTYPASPTEGIMQAIVRATDYLDQRYRFKGTKFLQFLAGQEGNVIDPFIAFTDPWLSPFGWTVTPFGSQAAFQPSTTQQRTEWPRQGCVDYNGDNVYGVPLVVQRATAEAALRVVNGTPLQPDYDPNLVANGGVLMSQTQRVGPIEVVNTYDTKMGLGFFPDIPHITRMLQKAGVLVASGGRGVIR